MVETIEHSWTILDEYIIKHTRKYNKCICKCGRIRYVNVYKIRIGVSRSCSNCCNRQYIGNVPKSVFTKIKKEAIYRNLSFNISQEFIADLLTIQNNKCAITGLPIFIADTKKEQSHGISTASLDRKDNDRGYEPDNIWWVHKDINMMKHTMSMEKFLNLCRAVEKNNNIDHLYQG